MRSSFIFLCVVACVAFAPEVFAQSPFDGPLAAPDAPAATAGAPVRHLKAKPKKPRHAAAAKPSNGHAAGASPLDAKSIDGQPSRTPTAVATPSTRQDDPVSLGMKWQGNNDTVGETRSQNLDGSAYGSGAEVGMKLHF